jgi:NAD(P)H-dependent FMN reductase
MLKIGIIIGSTRPGRKAEAVARWVHEIATRRNDAVYEAVDIQDFRLPLLDEPMPPSMGHYAHPHTKAWAERIGEFDGYVFVTPEYNHGTSGALKNAIDYLYREWNNKAAGFVGYGGAGGARAVESLRLVMGELQVADGRRSPCRSSRTSRTSPCSGRHRSRRRRSTPCSIRSLSGAARWRRCGRSGSRGRARKGAPPGLAKRSSAVVLQSRPAASVRSVRPVP